MNVKLWQAYASCWSAPAAERETQLARLLVEEVRYRDPNAEVEGRGGLSKYMAGFQQALPGHRFEIRSVDAHHGRSLARWRQLDSSGTPVADGMSFAVHDEDGRFREVTGFFPVAPLVPLANPAGARG
jgi:hypothetical protein